MIWQALRPHWAALALLLLAMALAALATGAYGVLVGPMLRALFGGAPPPWTGWMGHVLPTPPSAEALRRWMPLLILAVAGLKALSTYIQTVSQARIGQALIQQIRAQAHGRLLSMSPDAVTRWGTGDLISRLTHDVEAVEAMIFQGYGRLISDGAQVVVLIGACLMTSPDLALIAFGVYPVALWPMISLGRRLRKAGGDHQAERGALLSTLHRQIDRLPLIQLREAGGEAQAQIHAGGQALGARIVAVARLRGIGSPLMEVLGAGALAATIFYAGDRIAGGALTAEEVLSFFACLLLLYQPIKGLTRAQGVLAPGKGALSRVEALWRCDDLCPSGGAEPPPAKTTRISLKAVEIHRGGQRVLGPLDGEIQAGGITTLTGPNGSGKSTLVWAIGGLIPLAGGQIYIEDQPLSGLALRQWRQRIGWVTQEAWLSAGTLEANVAMGRSLDPTRRGELVHLAGLGPLLERLPEGWATDLQEGGRRLSGGERQRVALARALVGEPDVLILDEPDAHLDAEGREALLSTLSALAADRVVILIAHDPALADQGAADLRLPDRGA